LRNIKQLRGGLLHFRALKHLAGYLRLHPDLPMTFNRLTLAKEVSAINFDLLYPDLAAHVGSAFVEIIPATYNPSHESDPEGFTSCDNLFQSLDPSGDCQHYI
jgi:hypothetical protein